jgi:hypothetical protein
MIDFIAAGEAEIGGQRSALVAALFLDDLDQQHLAALDHVLDLVAAAQILALAAEFVRGGFVDRRAVGLGPGLRRFIGVALILGGGFFVGSGRRFLVVVELGRTQPFFLGGMLRLFAKQRIAVRLRDLIIIRVDFAEGQEAVAIAAIIDERRLQRRFYPGDLGEIDIAFELFVLSGFEVKLLDPVSLDDCDPGLLRVARVD